MQSYLRIPSLGGWLSILNCVFFLAFVVADRLGINVEVPPGYSVQLLVILFMSLPFGWAVLMPQLHYSPTSAEVAFNLAFLGCNSFCGDTVSLRSSPGSDA